MRNLLSDVVNKIINTHFGSERNVYAVLEVMEHPDKYPNIYTPLTEEIGLISNYQFYCDGKKEKSGKQLPDDDDEAAWLKLLSEDMEWLKSMETSECFTSDYFDGLSKRFTNDNTLSENRLTFGVPAVNFVGDRPFPQEILTKEDVPTIVYLNADWTPQNVINAHCDNLRELYSAFLTVAKSDK